jgi:hypothetical protein
MKRRTMMKARLTLALALLLLCTGAALASTPDGQTPSAETVCDSETGAAYGLCNAYCEAMDCDNGNHHASANACSKVRGKFQQITGRDLPCEATCPCIIAGDESTPFGHFVDGFSPVTSCATLPSSPFSGIKLGGAVDEFARVAKGDGGHWVCDYVFSDFPTVPPFPLTITEAEAQVCVQTLEQLANDDGVTCTP